MRDIAKSGEFFAKYSDEAGINILDTAIAANKLGVNLSVVEGISNNILDFSSSIEKEFLASTVLGRKINFNEARRLFLAKDTLGAMSAMRKELSGIDVNALDPISMKIVAEAFGTSAKDLRTMANQSKDLAKFTATTTADVKDQASAVNDLTADKALSEMTKMTNTTKNMAHILNQKMIPTFEKMDKVVSNITNSIEKFLGMISGLPMMIMAGVAAMTALFMWTRRTQMSMAMMGGGRMGMAGAAMNMAMMSGTAATGMTGPNMLNFGGGGLGNRAIQSGKIGFNPKTGRWHDAKTNKMVKTPKGGNLLSSSSRGMKGLRGGLRLAKGSGWLSVLGLGMDFMSNYSASGDLGTALGETAKSNAGMLGGAALGASIGAIFGGVGAGPGALIGAGIGGIVDMFRGGVITKDGKAYGYDDEDDVYLAMTNKMGIGPENALRKQNERLQSQMFSMAGGGYNIPGLASGNTNISFEPVEVKIKRDELNYILTPGRT
jgi:hypothetical protein